MQLAKALTTNSGNLGSNGDAFLNQGFVNTPSNGVDQLHCANESPKLPKLKYNFV